MAVSCSLSPLGQLCPGVSSVFGVLCLLEGGPWSQRLGQVWVGCFWQDCLPAAGGVRTLLVSLRGERRSPVAHALWGAER